MDKIYMDAKDKNVAKVVIYINAIEKNAQYIAYTDSGYTTPFTVDELRDAYLKDAVCRINTSSGVALATPLMFAEMDDVAQIAIIVDGNAIILTTKVTQT